MISFGRGVEHTQMMVTVGRDVLEKGQFIAESPIFDMELMLPGLELEECQIPQRKRRLCHCSGPWYFFFPRPRKSAQMEFVSSTRGNSLLIVELNVHG